LLHKCPLLSRMLETKVYVSYVTCWHDNDHPTARAYPSHENKFYLSRSILLKIIRQTLAIITTTEVKTGLFGTVYKI